MNSARTYSTASALRMALEQRLNARSRSTGIDLMKLRRQVAFDRFLVRMFSEGTEDLVAKGGYALELRFDQARPTRDIDFSFSGNLGGYWTGEPVGLQEFFVERAQLNLDDFFEYAVGPATLDLENAPYGGFRFPVEAKMAGRRFSAFSVDVAAGDVWFEPHESVAIHDWLDFAGVPSGNIPVINLEQQFAEKLHSYTQVREYPNSRTKDLVDMVLLVGVNIMSTATLQRIVRTTFSHRNKADFPPIFPDPPVAWLEKYKDIAAGCGVEQDISAACKLVRQYCVATGVARE